MNNESTNKEKIKKVTESGMKVLKVLKIISISLIVLFSIFCLSFFVLGIATEVNSDIAEKLIEWKFLGDISVKNEYNIFMGEKITIESLVEQGKFSELMFFVSGKMMVGIIVLILIIILCSVFNKIFCKINEVETPFCTELIPEFKKIFILISIVAVFCHIIVGIVISIFMVCLFYIYKHGCELQKEADETI